MRIKRDEVLEKIARLRDFADQLTLDPKVEFDRGEIRRSLQKANEMAKSDGRAAAALCVGTYKDLLWVSVGGRNDCSNAG